MNAICNRTFAYLFLLMLLLFAASNSVSAEDYPATCRVTTVLNVRSYPSTSRSKIGQLQRGDYITVEYITGTSPDVWGAISYGSQRGYVSMRYVEYLSPIQQQEEVTPSRQSSSYRMPYEVTWFVEEIWPILKGALIFMIIILIIALWEFIVEMIIYAAVFAGIGAVLFLMFGGDGTTGATVGLAVAVFTGLRLLISWMGYDSGASSNGFLRGVFLVVYFVISLPIYILNRLEHFLISPWRYMFMKNWAADRLKPTLRVITEILTIAMYIVTTPLRFVNAVIYNIIVHCITGIYDLFLEVLAPSDDKEGGSDVWKWIYMFPYRFLYYALWHTFLLLLESVIWTVVDIFIPARTFYHGTTLNAGTSITCDPHRNRYLQENSKWSSGNFLASSDPNCSWAGRGVYFAIRRGLALAYSGDNRSGYGGAPVMIACRVSMGRVISYALMPDRVYYQAGGGGWHDEINKFADAHGYTMGEWYNTRGVWEYCLFDWQHGYNHPWRIRPIYVLNLSTGLAQHISGGMQHWLFDKTIMKDLFE